MTSQSKSDFKPLIKSSGDRTEYSMELDEDIPKRRKQSLPFISSNASYFQVGRQVILGTIPIFLSLVALFSGRPFAMKMLNKITKDQNQLAALGVGEAWLLAIGLSVFISLNQGLTTRVSQAYGAKDLRLVGLLFHRALVINAFVLIPCIIGTLRANYFFKMFNFPDEVAEAAHDYLVLAIPGLIAFTIFNTATAVLVGCGEFQLPGIIQIVGTVCYWIMAYTLIYKAGLGLKGQAIAFDIMWILNLIILRWIIKKRDVIPGIFFKFERVSIMEVCALFKFNLIIGSMTWADFVAIEIMNLLVGSLSSVEIAAFTVAGTSYRLPYPLCIAVSICTTALVGNAIGERDIPRAKKLIRFSLFFNFTCAACIVFVFIVRKAQIASWLSPNKETTQAALAPLTIYILNIASDSTQLVLSSGLKGVGKEKIGAGIIAACDYFVAIPAAYFFCFICGMRLSGIAIGTSISIHLKIFLFLKAYKGIDYPKQCEIIRKELNLKDDDGYGLKQLDGEDIEDEIAQKFDLEAFEEKAL